MLDVVAPSLALGMAIGRIGCLLFGCCYGDYCEAPWAVRFPSGSPPHGRMVVRGHQSRLGFIVLPDDRRVLLVEPGSDAERSGLRVGDLIVAVNGVPADSPPELQRELLMLGIGDRSRWPEIRQQPFETLAFNQTFEVTVRRGKREQSFQFRPAATLPLHPTQLYSSVSNFLIFLVLLAYHPIRKRDGEVVALLAVLYPISRFLVEYLRCDESPLFDGLTISQNLSILLFVSGVILWLCLRLRPIRYTQTPSPPGTSTSPNSALASL